MIARETYKRLLEEKAPGFNEAVNLAGVHQQLLMSQVVTAPSVPRSVRLIFSLAASDLGDLFNDALRGAGRSACRAARSIVEHAINAHSVIYDADHSDRYMAHLSQGPLLLAELSVEDLVESRVGRSVRHELNKAAREARPTWDQALRDYGTGFRKAWAIANLHDRAVAAGMDDLYTFYRLASSVAHGSAAGAAGHYKVHDEGEVATFALGVSPTLVPVGLVCGVSGYLRLLETIEDAYPGEIDAIDAGSAALRAVKDHVTGVVEAVRAIDIKVTKKGEYSAYLAVTKKGLRRWYVSSTEQDGQWFRALGDDAALSVFQEWVEPVIARYFEDFETFNEAGLVAFAFPASIVPVRPDHSKTPIPVDVMPVVRSVDGHLWFLEQEHDLTGEDGEPLDDELAGAIQDGVFVGKLVREETSPSALEQMLSATTT